MNSEGIDILGIHFRRSRLLSNDISPFQREQIRISLGISDIAMQQLSNKEVLDAAINIHIENTISSIRQRYNSRRKVENNKTEITREIKEVFKNMVSLKQIRGNNVYRDDFVTDMGTFAIGLPTFSEIASKANGRDLVDLFHVMLKYREWSNSSHMTQLSDEIGLTGHKHEGETFHVYSVNYNGRTFILKTLGDRGNYMYIARFT